MQGKHFDASSDPDEAPERPPATTSRVQRRPFLGIQFSCCNMYARIYKSPRDACYRGHCPRCGRQVKVPIGSGGSAQRFFTAGD